MSLKSGFVSFLSVLFILFFASCSNESGKKCSEDATCKLGSYCLLEKGKCTDFGEDDYTISITAPKDGATICGEVAVEVTLGEVSEKLHDGMEVALTVAKNNDLQALKGVFSENTAYFKIDLSEKAEYKLSAFLTQNPNVTAEITLSCDSELNDEDDTSDEDESLDDDNTTPVDEDADTTPADEDTEPDDDSEPAEEKPVAVITSHPQEISSVTTAEFTFESDIEEATFKCKTDFTEWETCTSPKVYTGIYEGDHQFHLRAVNVGGTESDIVSFSWKVDLSIANIEILAPWRGDKLGNGNADTCQANNYGAAVSDGVIYVGTTQDVEEGDHFGICLKVGVSNTAAGAKINVYVKNGANWVANHEGNLSATDVANGFYMVNGFRLNEGENEVKVVVGGKTEDIADAEFIQPIVVATTTPEISWVFPSNNKIFSENTFSSQIFATFNIVNSIPGLDIVLFEGNTVVDLKETERLGSETLSFKNPELADSCSPREFHAMLYDTLNGNYANSGNRTITFDVNPPIIDAVSLVGKDGSDINSTVSAMQNPLTVSVTVSDSANVTGDTGRLVALYTNGGSGFSNKVLAPFVGTVDGPVVFENINLSETHHTLRVEVKDCTGNITSKTLDPVTVSLTSPVLTLMSPKGKGDDPRWLVLSDVDHLEGASVVNGELTGVKMHVVSNKPLSSITQAIHGFNSNSTDIIENAVLIDENNIIIDLPPLTTGKHHIIVNVLDFAGNPGKIGGGGDDYFEVDVVAPTINSLAFNTENYPTEMSLDVSSAAPETSFVLVATKGETVKTWKGVITEDGLFEKDLHLSKGEWSADLTLTDNHGNVTASIGNTFEVTHEIPDIVLKKNDGVTVLDVTTAERPIWFGHGEFINCAESSCKVPIRIYAPEGTEIFYGIGSADKNITIGHDGFEGFESVEVSLNFVTATEFIIISGDYKETYYLRATNSDPMVSISNPVVCPKSAEYCSIYQLLGNFDDATNAIELAEVGFGYNDDLTPGDGILNFKAGSAIKFTVNDSPNGGFIEIENPPQGFEYTKVKLVKSESIPGEVYIADFSNLIVPDINPDGQSDYDLVFVLTTDSGITRRYLVPLHLDLSHPDPVSAIDLVSTADALEGKLNFAWNPAATKPYAYEVRYQGYSGNCTIVDDFDSAIRPLTEFAGKITKPLNTPMNYTFFVNAVTNATETVTADIHKNGNSYCAAVAAVNSVFSNEGFLMAKNYGSVNADSVKDYGALKMNWTNIYETSSGYHAWKLKTIGDVDNDGFEDYAIANYYKSDSGVDNERNGFVDIYSGASHTLIKSIRGTSGWNVRWGQDISSKADFNGDGFNDFAFTDPSGNIFVFYGTETGIDFSIMTTDTVFAANDHSSQNYRNLATGDYNGDGCDDILVSAPSKTVDSYTNAGEVYLYYGCKEGGFVGDEPDLIFQGNSKDAYLGYSAVMNAGDLNGDGKTDFAFGSQDSIYIVYGGSSDGPINPTLKFSAGGNPGYFMGKGDFNGDGITDFVYNRTTESRIFFGSNSGLHSTPDLYLDEFSALYDNYGPYPTYKAVAVAPEAKDLNGDGADELIITSSTGLLIYFTYTDSETGEKHLRTNPSIYDDSFVSGSNPKVMVLDDAIIFCNNTKATGNCERLDF